MKNIEITRHLVLSLAAVFAAGLLFVNVYNSVVDAANWGSHFPLSIEAARAYFKVSNPGTFFRVASPLNQLITLVGLVLCWKSSPRLRLLCGIGFALSVANDIFSMSYFFPRNDILFHGSMDGQIDAVRQAVNQWIAMNWVRSAGVALNVVADFMALAALMKIQFGGVPSLREPAVASAVAL